MRRWILNALCSAKAYAQAELTWDCFAAALPNKTDNERARFEFDQNLPVLGETGAFPCETREEERQGEAPASGNAQPRARCIRCLTMLVSLEPLGVGTAECESLSSYFQRLAAIQGSRPGEAAFFSFAGVAGPPGARESRELGATSQRNQARWEHEFVLARRPLGDRIGHCDWPAHLEGPDGPIVGDCGPLRRGIFKAKRSIGTRAALPKMLSLFHGHGLAWLLQPSRLCLRHRLLLLSLCSCCGRAVPVIHERSTVEVDLSVVWWGSS